MHYHLIAITQNGTALANAKIDEWSDALDKYTSLSVRLFGHLFGADELAMEHASAVMDNGTGKGVMVGSHTLSLVLVSCHERDEECSWISPTWN